MPPLKNFFILALILVIAISGLRRLSFATDILDILPEGIPEVEAMRTYREHFDDDNKVVLMLQNEEEVFEDDAVDFAAFMGERLPDTVVEYRSPFEADPQSFARSLARMWADADPATAREMADTLDDPAARAALIAESKRKVELSIDQAEATRAAYDPLGFLNHPAMEQLLGNDFSYQSEDGTRWLIMLTKHDLGLGYQEHGAWVEEIKEAADQWDQEGFSYRLTGGPVVNAEVGMGMENDMYGSIVVTLLIVGFLFILVQRSVVQLGVLGVILGIVFLITLGLAGWIFGTLNLVSVGFAAILLGLVIDYGVVIARESSPGKSAKDLRREMAPSILWASLTTAVVFGLLTLSSFQGVQQLGGLILIGLVTGAAVCLWLMPLALEKFPQKKASGHTETCFLPARFGVFILAGLLVSSFAVFFVKGPPSLSFEVSMVQSETSEAAQTFEEIQERFPFWSRKNLTLIAEGQPLDQLRDSLKVAEEEIATLMDEGVLVRSEWPVKILPNLIFREANAAHWAEVSARSDEVLAELKEAGFSEKGRALNELVLKSLSSTPRELDPFARLFYQEDGYFSGRVQLREEVTEESVVKLDILNVDGVAVSGWPLLQLVILPRVKHDFYFLFIPATVVLLSALVLVFRSWRDALVTAGILVLVLLSINAFVVLTGRTWNFLSILAVPLVVGTGIDYSIHLVFALRRSGGDMAQAWNGVGKAILFCGLSTVVGFGSLSLSSNESLQSMGLLCAIGVFLTMSLSVLVVPGLWQFLHRPERVRE